VQSATWGKKERRGRGKNSTRESGKEATLYPNAKRRVGNGYRSHFFGRWNLEEKRSCKKSP